MQEPRDPLTDPNQVPPEVRRDLSASVYGAFRAIAARRLRAERPDPVLEPTDVVHEAWMRMEACEGHPWRDRNHFIAFGAEVIRQVLIDQARARGARKRGGSWSRLPLRSSILRLGDTEVDVLDLDEALQRLASVNERQARIVELRFFGGFAAGEVAHEIGVSVDVVKRQWRFARAWLNRELGRGSEE